LVRPARPAFTGAFCFGCGYLTAFIVTRNRWRDEMIKRGVARYNANGNGESRRKSRDIECRGDRLRQ
jgi:hypothetical protein